MEDLIDVTAVAKILKMSKAGVFGLVHRKKIHCIKLSRRCLRFSRSSIESWIQSKCQLATEQREEPATRTTATKKRLSQNGRRSNIDALLEQAKKKALDQ